MDPATIIALLGLGGSVAGAAGNAYLGSQAANDQKKLTEEQMRTQAEQLALENARADRAEPINTIGSLAQLRQLLSKPTSHDFLSSMAARYGHA